MTLLRAIAIIFCVFSNCLLRAESIKEATNSQPSSQWNDSPRKLNVLMLTVMASGHTAVPLALGEELAKRGHHVTLCMAGNKYQTAAETVGIAFKSNGPSHDFTQYGQQSQTHGGIGSDLTTLLGLKRGIGIETENYLRMFEEGHLGRDWDIVIATDFISSLLPCLSEYLNVPALLTHTSLQTHTHTYPSWPWASLSIKTNTDDITFSQRFVHAIERALGPHLLTYVFTPANRDKLYAFCPQQARTDLITAPSTRIPDIVPSVIGVEYPRTISPLSHYVGPILTEHPSPCTDKLESWLNNKEDKSVIYISMGSVTLVTKELAKAFIGGIKKTNYSVLWAMKKTEHFELDIDPERFFTGDWLPQLSVLRHRATSLAIMHGGANGVHESLHSGVPLILVPGMIEQNANAGRVHHHRLGTHLNKQGLTAEQVYQSIVEIDSGDYRKNVRKLQKVFRAAGGAKRAADLVEFYSEVGYDHLIPAYAKYNWNWVQYYNADVYTLLLVCALVTLYIDYKILKCLYSRCCKSKKQKNE